MLVLCANRTQERLYQFSWEITATRVFTLRRHWQLSFVPLVTCGGARWYASRIVFRPNYSTQPHCGLCYCDVRVALESPFASLYRTPRSTPSKRRLSITGDGAAATTLLPKLHFLSYNHGIRYHHHLCHFYLFNVRGRVWLPTPSEKGSLLVT